MMSSSSSTLSKTKTSAATAAGGGIGSSSCSDGVPGSAGSAGTGTCGGETNLSVLLQSMKPTLNDGEYVFTTVPHNVVDEISKTNVVPLSDIICTFHEKEGTTLVLEKQKANLLHEKMEKLIMPSSGDSQSAATDTSTDTYYYSWITLEVHSSLNAVGLTAAFSNALTKENISCNVIAGYYHDHIFVNTKDKYKAMKVLQTLSSSASSSSGSK